MQQVVVELEAGDLVERGEGLVHQQQLRLGDQRAGDRDAHLHAAGQFARIARAKSRKADAGQRIARRAWRRARRRRPRDRAAAAHWRRRRPTASESAPGTRSRCCARPARQATEPADGALRPAMMRSAVDLPQPEGPSSETNSPSRTSRSKPPSATVPRSNVLPTSRSETIVLVQVRLRHPLRHARPCAGHPRLCLRHSKDVDGRDKPGHDSKEAGR